MPAPLEVPAPPTPAGLRVDFPFTARDTRAVRARIVRDLAEVAKATREADPSLRAVLLLGGYARGEGTTTREGPVNDYDLMAVRSAARAPRGLYADLADRLERKLGIAIDLAPIWEARLRFVPRTIFWYEAREAGRTILGEEVRPRIRPIDATDLPVQEGIRLLFNRAAGLLVAADRDPDPFLLTLQAAKAHLACAEAVLVARGRYHWSLRERARRFRDVPLPEGLAHLPDAVDRATAWKLSTDARPDPAADAVWDDARDDLLDTLALVLRSAGTTLARALRKEPLSSRLVWLARARRLGPSAPRARTRAACLDLLGACDGGRPRAGAQLERARRLLHPFGLPPNAGFDALKDSLLAAREKILT